MHDEVCANKTSHLGIFLHVLVELYHCLVISVGTLAAFRRVYEDPILMSRQPNASCEERLLGQNRARELNRITSLFVLRRTQDVNNQYLPPRGLLYFFKSSVNSKSIFVLSVCTCTGWSKNPGLLSRYNFLNF